MFRSLSAIVLLTLASLYPTAASAGCLLEVSISCPANLGAGQSGNCTAITLNSGTAPCTGFHISGLAINTTTAAGTLGIPASTAGFLTQCLSLPTDQGGALSFCAGEGTLLPGQSYGLTGSVQPSPTAPSPFSMVGFTQIIDPETSEDLVLALSTTNIVLPTCVPGIAAPGVVQSGTPYSVTWSPTSDPTTYELQESTSPDFAGASVQTTTTTSVEFRKNVTTSTKFFYRVRATTCKGAPGVFSSTVTTSVVAPLPATAREFDLIAPVGTTTPISQQVFIPAPVGKSALNTMATASTDKPFLTVTPSSFTIPPGGTTVTVTATPGSLPAGANTGTLLVTGPGGSSIGNVPVAVSLVTPVTSGGKPPGSGLIIPAVAHVDGSAKFQSDVRVTNGGSGLVSYQLAFTPSNSDATLAGKQTKIDIAAGKTVALNDIVKNFFGLGATAGDQAGGVLEITPLGVSPSSTFASSRTYATTEAGTLGQFIPAIPISKFIANDPARPALLSLQQVAQSEAFRTNLGLVEGFGQAASGRIAVFNGSGMRLGEFPFALKPGEHQQLNSFLATKNITLTDGRIEVTVDSPTGAITAYASVVDNKTNDPLLVSPVQTNLVAATRYVLPGVADLTNSSANFQSDIRIFNAGTAPVDATLTFFPQGSPGSPRTRVLTIAAKEVKAIDGALPSLFNVTGAGGSILVTTAAQSSLVVTGRTYSRAAAGTFGQFIPAISPSEGIGMGDRPLQVLQLEDSKAFRTNVGLAELTGQPATVELTLIAPDLSFAPTMTVELLPNEFKQLNSVLKTMLPGANTYNARMSVKVIRGAGRVTAYGSVIDNRTQDPTYVPAQ